MTQEQKCNIISVSIKLHWGLAWRSY